MRLDSREKFEGAFEEYLSRYGWHFSKKLCEHAVSKMKKGDKKITPYTKEMVDAILKKYNIELENQEGYDYVYIANMCRADFYGSSIPDESHLALFIKDYLEDYDGYAEMAFTRFYADCIGKGCVIIWEDML